MKRRTDVWIGCWIFLIGSAMLFGEPIGTAFTYQGRLLEGGDPAEGVYDFRFALFDSDLPAALPAGPVAEVNDLDVAGGYFTAQLDFGSDAFDGQARWLQIAVRPWDLTEPNAFVVLSPRQSITPGPYALWSKRAGTINVPLAIDSIDTQPILFITNTGTGPALYGRNTSGINESIGIFGQSFGDQGAGVVGSTVSDLGSGVVGDTAGGYGIHGRSKGGIAVYGETETGQAGYFVGPVEVTGDVQIGGDTYIDGDVTVDGALLVSGSVVGDITDVNAGPGLTGGGMIGSIELAVEVPLSLTCDQENTAAISGYGTELSGLYGEGKYYGVDGYSFSGYGIRGGSDEGFGVVGFTDSLSPLAAAVRGTSGTNKRGSLGGLDYGVKSEGDLIVDGGDVIANENVIANGDIVANNSTVAYRGALGPNGGAPFPRPAYDSGWQAIAAGSSIVLGHNIGGNVDHYVVDLQFKDTAVAGSGVNNGFYGGNDDGTLQKGVWWRKLNDKEIRVERYADDDFADEVRVRIWVYN